MNTTPSSAPQQNVPTFATLGIQDNILKVLSSKGFEVPTPIQWKSIPIACAGEDVIGIAQTGTGKTLAFAIPVIQEVLKTDCKALVLVPTRELALQVEDVFKVVGTSLGIRTGLIMGGVAVFKQRQVLQRNPHILIATPGRLIDLLDRDLIKLKKVQILVLDEADRMFDMGFAPQVNQILKQTPSREERQTLLFSATMPPEVIRLVTGHMKMPVHVEVAPQGAPASNVEQEMIVVHPKDKGHLLSKVIKESTGPVLVFSRTKYGAEKLMKSLRQEGHAAVDLHSNKSLAQRQHAMEGFKSGKYRIMVATDIAARGIDVSNIELVINYDLPESAEDYVHRIGRTGRAGKTGRALSFCASNQGHMIAKIERLMSKKLSRKQMHDFF
ncbi:MAG: hypothetical protein ACD_28C00291G0003 [uncultured bacterium]|nr:MAG: hypothetical protein ACD_28C00291G0003 [uncultured bacterium]